MYVKTLYVATYNYNINHNRIKNLFLIYTVILLWDCFFALAVTAVRLKTPPI